jgi:hypothetical protein
MKNIIVFLFLSSINSLFSQISTSRIPISYTNSSNSEFVLKSISYDDEFPNLKGESFVFYKEETDSLGSQKLFYKINRSFDIYDEYPYFAAISNDGRKIIYIKNQVYYEGEQHKNVTYYVDGKLVKTYTTEEFIDCNREQEKCEMFYDNQHSIYKNQSPTTREFKDEITEKDKFLNKNYIFNKNDTIYIIDSRKKLHLFDLNKNVFIKRKIDFDSIYPKIKNLESVKSQVSYYNYPYKEISDIENSINDKKLSESISEISNLKYIQQYDSTYFKYKLHRIELTGYLDRNGKFEIDSIYTDKIFNKDKIINYLKSARFKTDFIPKEVNKIYLTSFFGGYRNYDVKIAEQETIKEKEDRIDEFKKRLTLEKINNIYIPKNLHECMLELDKILNFENKRQLKEAKNVWEFNSHMGGLGMWLRNNWGINGGSRLSKYFDQRLIEKVAFVNDEISEIIIRQYIIWLKGDKKAWEKWEKENPIRKIKKIKKR